MAKRNLMKSILVVEDDPGCLKNICAFLREEGYQVTEAHDGDEAIDLMTDAAFDLILTDIRMPRTNGIRLLDRVRAISPETPVILMTAFAPRRKRASAENLIIKPLILSQLLAKIDRAIEGKRAGKP